MQHKIREQVMDLTIRSRQDAFRAQHLAGPFYYRQLLPALEKIFDELSVENEIINIDRLELDLGFIPLQALEASTWNSEWENLLREQIKTALLEQGKNAGILRSNLNTNSCRHWLFYMQHGYLDWNINGFDERALTDVLEILATDYTLVLQFRRLIQKSPQARLRIVSQHDEKFLVSLVEILTASKQRNLPVAVTELATILQALRTKQPTLTNPSKRLVQEVWQNIIVIAAQEIRTIQTNAFIEKILLKEPAITSIEIQLPQAIESLKIIAPVLKAVQLKKKIAEKLKAPEKEITGKKEDEVITETTEIDNKGIFVANAGLALLHPFFYTFFKRLELASGSHFHNAASTEKAVHLLYYLATGKTNPAEHELVIPKLFCALPLHYALKETIELSEEEKQEADDMIQAAIDKWEKLKNISIDAMRQNFLVRPGKLYTKNDLLYLQVESGSLDVLLDYLPWTLSILKLPWMKELLRIEWR